MLSSRILHCSVRWILTDVTEELTASIISVISSPQYGGSKLL
jgi:hypothetical protein